MSVLLVGPQFCSRKRRVHVPGATPTARGTPDEGGQQDSQRTGGRGRSAPDRAATARRGELRLRWRADGGGARGRGIDLARRLLVVGGQRALRQIAGRR